MREVYSHQDFTRVGFYKSILDEAGILSLIRNESVSVTEPSVPIFCPALCVMNDEDYDAAMKLLGEIHYAPPSYLPAWHCTKCKEEVPGNFDSCWNCGTAREASA